MSTLNMKDFPPSEYLINKRKELKRKKYIKYLLTPNKSNNLPLLKEINPKILNDKDLFSMAFTLYPILAEQISLKIPESIQSDDNFMLEMYHITKYMGIFKQIKSKILFLDLLKINPKFFNLGSQKLYSDIKFMYECVSINPIIVSNYFIPYIIKNEFNMINSSIKIINSVRTFLLCIQKKESNINWLKGFSGQVMEICKYLKPILYPVFNYHFIGYNSNLECKCMELHTCKHCSLKIKLENEKSKLKYRSINKFIKVRTLQNINQLEKEKEKLTICTKNTFCKSCPNLEDRKQWIKLIRTKAISIYGLQVI